jgi:hypothetical protein
VTRRPQTPAARALVGCLSLGDGATTNEALKLAGYENKLASPLGSFASCARVITRNGRIVKVTRNAYRASDWLARLGRKLEAFAVRKVAA